MNGDGTGIKISGSDSGTMQSLATKMQERTQGMAKGCPLAAPSACPLDLNTEAANPCAKAADKAKVDSAKADLEREKKNAQDDADKKKKEAQDDVKKAEDKAK